MEALQRAVEASHKRVGSPRRLLIGLSGGKDSMALTLALLTLRERLGLELTAAHVHHGLRENADADEAFVRAFCEAQGLRLLVAHVSVPLHGSMEAAAREARYEAFHQLKKETGAELLVLGHHLNDQAETVLMRLLRGSGSIGLQGMLECAHGVWRPLLKLTGADIRCALEAAHQPWREDESNQDTRFLRNALRLSAMPLLERLVPGAASGLARSADILASENAWWESFVADWQAEHASTEAPCLFLMADACRMLPLAARRRVLRGLCAAARLEPEFQHIERLDALLSGPPIAWESLPGGMRAFRSRRRLHLVPPGVEPLPLGRFFVRPGPAPLKPKKALSQAVDLDKIQGATLRYRQPGDYFVPIQAGGGKPLSEYLIDQGVDRPFRDHWPVLARGSELLWLPGISLAKAGGVSPHTVHPGLIHYEGRLPHQLNSGRMSEE